MKKVEATHPDGKITAQGSVPFDFNINSPVDEDIVVEPKPNPPIVPAVAIILPTLPTLKLDDDITYEIIR